MAAKEFSLDEHTVIKLYKRKATRSIRISVQPSGDIRVTLPYWAPYAAGIQFAKAKYDWIKSQQIPKRLIAPGQHIGKTHKIQYIQADKIKSIHARVLADSIYIRYPAILDWQDAGVQLKAEEASIRALRLQSETLLPERLSALADKYGYGYSSVTIKRLKSRWGSCDNQKNIVLNLFLMQLPWRSIDYVLLHELVHTVHMNHSQDFWDELQRSIPDLKFIRKELRDYQPLLNSVPHEAMS